MIGSIKGNLYRLFRSKSLYGLLFIVVLITLYACLIEVDVTNKELFSNDKEQVEAFVDCIKALTVINIFISCLFVYLFNVGKGRKVAIKNKIASGTSRLDIYVSDLLSAFVSVVLYNIGSYITVAILAMLNGVKVAPDAACYVVIAATFLFFIPLATLISGSSYSNQLITILFAVVMFALCYAIDSSVSTVLEGMDHEYMSVPYKEAVYLDHLNGYAEFTVYRLEKNPDFTDTSMHDACVLIKKANPMSIFVISNDIYNEFRNNNGVEDTSCNPNECPKMQTKDCFVLSAGWSLIFIVAGLVVYKKMEIK